MKKLNEKQIKRNLAFTVFMILFILSFFIFNPAWSEDHDQDKYEDNCAADYQTSRR